MTQIPLAQSPMTRRTVEGASSWIETLARVGYASRGVIYITIGAASWYSARSSSIRTIAFRLSASSSASE